MAANLCLLMLLPRVIFRILSFFFWILSFKTFSNMVPKKLEVKLWIKHCYFGNLNYKLKTFINQLAN